MSLRVAFLLAATAWLAPSADTAPQPAGDLPTTLVATEAPRAAVAADGPGSAGEEDDDDDEEEHEGSRHHRKNGPAPADSRRPPRPEAHRPPPGRGGPERGWQGQSGFRRGPPPGSQSVPHAALVMRRLDEVMEKLSRIEAQLHASPPAHPGSHPAPQPVYGGPPEAGQRMRAEIQERMEQARRRFGEMEERIRRLEAEVERLKQRAGEPPAKL